MLFDAASRPEFGPVGERFAAGRADRHGGQRPRGARSSASFEIGPSFGIDGTIMTSDDNWLRLFPDRSRDEIELGLIRLRPGADPVAVRDRLRAYCRRTCW